MKLKKNQTKIGVILSYLNVILGNVIPFFYTPVMLSVLGKSEYGLYKLAGSVTSYLSLMSLGIGSSVTRFLIKAEKEGGKAEEEKMFGLFNVFFRIIAVLTILVGTVLSFHLNLWYADSLSASEMEQMRLLVLILTFGTAVTFSFSPFSSVVSAHERFIFMQGTNCIFTLLLPVINLLLLFLGGRSLALSVASCCVSLAFGIVQYIYVRKSLQLRVLIKKPSEGILKDILTFSFWVFVANVASQLYNITDTVMIGSVPALGTDGVAVYNVGASFNSIVLGLAGAFSAIISPKINKMVFGKSSEKEISEFIIRTGRLQTHLIVLIVSGFAVFGRPFIYFYAGEEYADAYWVALLMMIPNMIPLAESGCLCLIIAQNKHRFRSLVYLGIALLNVIGTWFLMHTGLGIIGAALMTGIALVTGQGIVMNLYYAKRTFLPVGHFWKEVGKLFVLPVLMGGAGLLIGEYVNFRSIPVLISGIVIYAVVYCLFDYFIVMNKDEKKIIREPIQKAIHMITKKGV